MRATALRAGLVAAIVTGMRRRQRSRLGTLAVLGAVLAVVGTTAAAGSTTGTSGTSGTSGTTGTSGALATPKVVSCPAGIASAPVSPDQWIWSAYGAPSSSSSTVTYSVSGGKGSWNNGQATGTICSRDQGGSSPKRSVVLKVSGVSTLTPHATRIGLLGVALVLPVTVSKSGDPAVCPVGATGTVSLFASYYSVHHDKASMQFAGTCAAWDETFTGSILHVEISHYGAEIR